MHKIIVLLTIDRDLNQMKSSNGNDDYKLKIRVQQL